MVVKSIELTQTLVWSDRDASQCKAKWPFYFVGRYPFQTKLEMKWNFFKSGHGKGEHDGAGVVIKRTLTHEQWRLYGLHMNCAAHVVESLRKNMSSSAIGVYSS